MEQYEEKNHNEDRTGETRVGANRWLAVALVVLLGIAGIAFVYGYRQQALAHQLTDQQSVANASMNQLQNQVTSLTAKLNEMTAAQEAQKAAADAAAQKAQQPRAKGASSKGKGRPAVDKRYQQLQTQLADQQKQLKETQDLVAKNRADLEGNLSSTRDELNGSIATTHEELVALEKRGERNYFEFDLSKSKQFQRIGPLTLSLRKADTKHKSYDLAMIVDDNELNKKKVNLYEPVWIHTESESQPVQIVVNKIEKNLVHGYISAPKYKPSELASATVTPVSTKPPVTTPNPQDPQKPQQPEQ
jgi:cell division protein FtsB